jgi:hypothetical protein
VTSECLVLPLPAGLRREMAATLSKLGASIIDGLLYGWGDAECLI